MLLGGKPARSWPWIKNHQVWAEEPQPPALWCVPGGQQVLTRGLLRVVSFQSFGGNTYDVHSLGTPLHAVLKCKRQAQNNSCMCGVEEISGWNHETSSSCWNLERAIWPTHNWFQKPFTEHFFLKAVIWKAQLWRGRDKETFVYFKRVTERKGET